MRSSFFGIETARSAINAAQTALNVTGQNMSNANTPGYTRQSARQSAINTTDTAYKYALLRGTNLGQGVKVDDIYQIRDQFLDVRYRKANAESNTLQASASTLSEIKNILDETLTDGLNVSLGNFFKQLHTFSDNAGDIEFANILRSSANMVASSLNIYSNQLNDIKEQQVFDLEIITNEVNTIIKKIDDINNIAKNNKVNGVVSNELKDARNLYIDQLSTYININVIDNNDGTLSIMSGSEYVIDAKTGDVESFSIDKSGTDIKFLGKDGTEFALEEGQIKGYLQTLNGKGDYAVLGEESFRGIQYYQKALDDLAKSFGETFNTLNGAGKPLFEDVDFAGTIKISDQWRKDANHITATNDPSGEEGANDNIVLMIDAMNNKDRVISPLFTGSFEQFATSLMADVAVDLNYTNSVKEATDAILNSVSDRRESIMGVSINDETVDLMKYQKAFEAASRVMSVLDEALDIIINRMGLIGR